MRVWGVRLCAPKAGSVLPLDGRIGDRIELVKQDMLVAAIYDIHGNLPALESVLDEINSISVDRIVVGGDILPGPFPVETIELLRSVRIPIDFISGNGERETLELLAGKESRLPQSVQDAMTWNGRQLNTQQQEFVGNFPETLRLTLPQVGEVLFCHASPRNDNDIFTKNTPDKNIASLFLDSPQMVVCGHTHMQFDRRVGNVRVINAGSVGMAFGSNDAQWLLIGNDFQFKSTEYDIVLAGERIRSSDYPDSENFVSNYVENHPSESEMIAMYESVATQTLDPNS